jgi:phosphoglycolate phosphatase-like HAD superfamily hydrolase
MIRNILFDFDGVILDSMKIKGDGFLELFKEYPHSALQKLENYHYANGGVSRFAKIRYFFNDVILAPITDKEVEILADTFAQIIAEKLFDSANLIAETVKFIDHHCAHYKCHIVSGAEESELKALCKHVKIDHYFKSIHGSPTPKSQLVNAVLHQYHYRQDETILIGDSINDYQAAQENTIRFYGYNNPNLKSLGNYLETFNGFLP